MDQHQSIPRTTRSSIDRAFAYIARRSESESLLIKLFLGAAFVSLLWLLATLALGWRTEVPVPGGTLREGVVGTPRFVNPVLAVTRADRDTSALIFDGLMTLGRDGTLVPNVAESVTVSEDGLTYNVILRRDVFFHDDTPLSALDVVFTVNRIKDPLITSPLRAHFDNVSVEQVGDYEVNFILTKPYAPFIENLTFGILPEHIWEHVKPEEFPLSTRNIDAIGSGPYAVSNIKESDAGIPVSFALAAHEGYHRGTPKLARIDLIYFPSGEALAESFTRSEIDSFAGVDPSTLFGLQIDSTTHTLHHLPLPRVFALFFNQNRSTALRDRAVREALATAIDRTTLVDTVVGGYGIPLPVPVPTGFGLTVDGPAEPSGDRSEAARAILKNAGWKLNPDSTWERTMDGETVSLDISIATANTPLFEATAEHVRREWEQIGARVTVKQFEQSDLTQGVIRPRDYEVLLFGTQVGRALDFYPFWHSSQRNDPGLNVALYTNISVDELLDTARTTTDITQRNDALIAFSDEVETEIPAIFLYQPELLYVFPNTITGASFTGVGEAHERFASVHDWYAATESIWSFLQ